MISEELEFEISRITQKYRFFNESRLGSNYILAGPFRFSTIVDNQEIKDDFQLSITIPEIFPIELPIIKEIDGRIPKEFHTNPDGTLCLEAPIKLRMIYQIYPRLLEYLEQTLVPFLVSFIYFESEKKLPFGERAHGGEGLLECYKEVFDSKNITEILRYLYVLTYDNYNKRMKCPCGSGKRFNGCHYKKIMKIKRIGKESSFLYDYAQIILFLKKIDFTIPDYFFHEKLIQYIKEEKNDTILY